MQPRQTAITLLYCETSLDLNDVMLKSEYDTDNDGYVDKIKKLTDIEELELGYVDGQVPKIDEFGDSTWQDDNADGEDFDIIDGGIFT